MTHAVRTKVSTAMRMSAFSPHQRVLAINSPGSQQFHCRSWAGPHYAGGPRTHRIELQRSAHRGRLILPRQHSKSVREYVEPAKGSASTDAKLRDSDKR